MVDRVQKSRFEHKYLLSDKEAHVIRAYLGHGLLPDPHAGSDGAYEVSTLYLDSNDMELCNATMQGLKNRFKLRLRWYANTDEDPLYVEIKRRVNDQVIKHRARIQRASAIRLIAGYRPSGIDLLDPPLHGEQEALEQFSRLRDSMQARATVHVRYRRQAWVPRDGADARVTCDTNLMGMKFSGRFSTVDGDPWVRPDLDGVILELKFTDRFPRWMEELVRMFNLERVSLPKYVTCAEGLDGFRDRLLSMSN